MILWLVVGTILLGETECAAAPFVPMLGDVQTFTVEYQSEGKIVRIIGAQLDERGRVLRESVNPEVQRQTPSGYYGTPDTFLLPSVWLHPSTRSETASYAYDNSGRLELIQLESARTTFAYDRHGNLSGRVTYMGKERHVSEWTYDCKGRMLREDDYSGPTLNWQRSYRFDSLGREIEAATRVFVPATSVRTTTTRYDRSGRLVEKVTRSGEDKLEYHKTVSYAEGSRTESDRNYDDGRLITRTTALYGKDGTVVVRTYGPNGELIEKADRVEKPDDVKGTVIHYSPDGRVETKIVESNRGEHDSRSDQYDAEGNLLYSSHMWCQAEGHHSELKLREPDGSYSHNTKAVTSDGRPINMTWYGPDGKPIRTIDFIETKDEESNWVRIDRIETDASGQKTVLGSLIRTITYRRT